MVKMEKLLKQAAVIALSCVLLSCGATTDENPDAGKTYTVQVAAGDARTKVYETSKRGEIVLLELYRDKIVFTALISRSKFEEVMALEPPTYFKYRGAEYVKNDATLFWGPSGNEESVSVDGKLFGGFTLNKGQIVAEGEAAQVLLQAARSADRLQLEKHYWGPDREKHYPSFGLSGLRESLDKLSPSSGTSFVVSDAQTRCKQEGARKIVWLETDEGAFALNGPAIKLVKTSRESGSPWRDAEGRAVRLGRNVLGVDVTSSLIEAGVKKCD